MQLRFNDDNEKQNYIKYLLSNIFANMARVFSVGTVIQTFMLEYGISENNTALYSSIVQIAHAIVIFSMIFLARYIKKEKVAITLVFLSGVLVPITLLVFAICTQVPVSIAFFVITAVSLLVNLALGVQSVLCYTFPYKIINMENYGRFAGLMGAVSYPASLLSIFLMTFFTARFNYFTVMSIFFAVGVVSWILSAYFIFRIKENKQVSVVYQDKEMPSNTKFNVFKYKPTYLLILPNLLRGFAVGVIGQLIVFGYHDNILNGETANWATFLYYAGIMVSNFLYIGLFEKRNTPFILLLLGGISATLMPLVVVSGNVYVFLLVYFLLYAILGIFDVMFPVVLTKIFPYEGIGTFTSIRMFLMSVGQAIPGLIFDWLCSILNTVGILIVGGVCLLCGALIYAGVMWYLQYKNTKIDLKENAFNEEVNA